MIIMENDMKRKISLMHSLFGLIFGIVTAYVIHTILTFGQVIFLGLLVSYPLFIATRKILNLSAKEFALKDWLASGFLYFFIVWILSWTFAHNLVH